MSNPFPQPISDVTGQATANHGGSSFPGGDAVAVIPNPPAPGPVAGAGDFVGRRTRARKRKAVSNHLTPPEYIAALHNQSFDDPDMRQAFGKIKRGKSADLALAAGLGEPLSYYRRRMVRACGTSDHWTDEALVFNYLILGRIARRLFS